MRIQRPTLALALLFLVPGCATAQAPASAPAPLLNYPPTSLTFLIQSREELGLSEEQVAQLVVQDEALRLQNRPLEEELGTLLQKREERRAARGSGSGGHGGRGGGRMGGGMGGGKGGGGRRAQAGASGEEEPGRKRAGARRLLGLIEGIERNDRGSWHQAREQLGPDQVEAAETIVTRRSAAVDLLRESLGPKPREREFSAGE